MMRMAGAIGKSTEVMKAMQSLIRVPEISQTMMELSKEMTKVLGAGVGGVGHMTCHMTPPAGRNDGGDAGGDV